MDIPANYNALKIAKPDIVASMEADASNHKSPHTLAKKHLVFVMNPKNQRMVHAAACHVMRHKHD